jgi:uncharacterized protein (DUF1697 family)
MFSKERMPDGTGNRPPHYSSLENVAGAQPGKGEIHLTTFVSLLRGINVGGHQKIRMEELKGLYESLGLKDVATYIQSGNVVFTNDDADLAQLPRQIEDGFAKKFGFHSKVIVRTEAELREIIENNPFQNQPMKESKWVVVMFLATRPDSTALEDLRKAYVGPEEFCMIGKDLYIYYTNGIGRSKLSASMIEKKLKTTGTGRNWNTVLQLQKMIQR